MPSPCGMAGNLPSPSPAVWLQLFSGTCSIVGGFPTIRHNEVRDLTANLWTKVCHDVRVEPSLQPITGEVLSNTTAVSEDGARLDIAASGFWGGRSERAFFDVRVFNPYAPSDNPSPPATESTKT